MSLVYTKQTDDISPGNVKEFIKQFVRDKVLVNFMLSLDQ